jgi:hypothetical protein
MSDEAQELVRSIRALAPEPNVRRVVVGGPTAARLDLTDGLTATLPWLALEAGAVVAALLFAAFGSAAPPIKAFGSAVPPMAAFAPAVPPVKAPSVDGNPRLVQARSFRKHPYLTPAGPLASKDAVPAAPVPAQDEDGPRWVRVTEGRARVVRATPDGAGWTWVEEDP